MNGNGLGELDASGARQTDELLMAVSRGARRLYGENHEAILAVAVKFAGAEAGSGSRLQGVALGIARELRERAREDAAVAYELERLAGPPAPTYPPERL